MARYIATAMAFVNGIPVPESTKKSVEFSDDTTSDHSMLIYGDLVQQVQYLMRERGKHACEYSVMLRHHAKG